MNAGTTAEPASSQTSVGDKLDVPYLLALNVALVEGPDGDLYADPLWARDLLRHLSYLSRLTLFTPVERRDVAASGFVALGDSRMRIVAYPAARSLGGWLRGLPHVLALLWREIGRARIVHTAIAGHPVPIGWLAVPMAKWRRRRTIVIVESAFWRIPHGQPASRLRRVRAAVWEFVNRAIMRRVDHAFYSHEQYGTSLPAPRADTSTIFQASWIDGEEVMPADVVAACWDSRQRNGGPARFLFAARMVAEKGTGVLLAAIDRLAARDVAVAIDVIGTGPELAAFADKARTGWGARHLRVLEPVAYGAPFSRLLADYDAIIVPSLSDEQPRIIYDAYAVGVGAIASDRPGLRQCIQSERTGRLVPAGDADALAEAIASVADDRAVARAWGVAGLALAEAHTHDRMHEDRAAVLAPFYPEAQR